MSRRKENGMVLQEKNGVIYMVVKLAVRRRLLYTLIILLALFLIILGSSLDQDIRNIIADFLLSVFQSALFIEKRLGP